MASPAVALNTDKTLDCTFITTHFSMGIGRMRQVRNLVVTTTADKTQLRQVENSARQQVSDGR
jgi:hypothetical protein